ncbi:MAG: energy transducer TonB [Ignavibacteriaceae bacterium]
MKTIKLILFFLLATILISGCKEKKAGIEIVPNLETIYMPMNSTDLPTSKDKYFDEKKFDDVIASALKTLNEKNKNNLIRYRIALRFFINEEGGIDKIKDIGSASDRNEFIESIKNYTNREKLDKELAMKLVDFKFPTATKYGKDVKYSIDYKLDFLMKPGGTYKIEISDFLRDMPNMSKFDMDNKMPDMNAFIKVDKPPQVISFVPPEYPESAKLSGLEGNVYVKIFVDKEGKPVKAVIIKSDHDVFNQAAVDAAMKFKFSPALKDKKPVAVWVVVPFRFKFSK